MYNVSMLVKLYCLFLMFVIQSKKKTASERGMVCLKGCERHRGQYINVFSVHRQILISWLTQNKHLLYSTHLTLLYLFLQKSQFSRAGTP